MIKFGILSFEKIFLTIRVFIFQMLSFGLFFKTLRSFYVLKGNLLESKKFSNISCWIFNDSVKFFSKILFCSLNLLFFSLQSHLLCLLPLGALNLHPVMLIHWLHLWINNVWMKQVTVLIGGGGMPGCSLRVPLERGHRSLVCVTVLFRESSC